MHPVPSPAAMWKKGGCVHMMGSTYGAVHFYCFPSSSEFVEKRWISRGSGWARVYPCTYFYCSYFPPCSEFIGKRPIITSSVCVWCVNTTLQYNITPQSFMSTDVGRRASSSLFVYIHSWHSRHVLHMELLPHRIHTPCHAIRWIEYVNDYIIQLQLIGSLK